MLYLECYSGISGDMTVAALLDLGASREKLEKGLASLRVDGYQVKIGRRSKCGIDACCFDVELSGEEDGHSHDYVEFAHEGHVHFHDGHAHGAHSHCHDDHEHSHGEHHHSHTHRNLRDIREIIDGSDMTPRAKKIALRIFEIVAEAEAKVHGRTIEEVHFHEVGAVDSIVDIAATAICLDDLDITEAVISEISEGSGHVHCQHGILPVPVPAVTAIAENHGLYLRLTDTAGEMVTPTGAAIAAGIRTREELPASYRIVKMGMGAGKKDFPKANILRAFIIEEKKQKDITWMLETNIDDVTGEALGYVMDRLLRAGARDVCYIPIFMKKNRPAYLMKVVCDEAVRENLEEIIFLHTTTIGIRRYPLERTMLPRKIITLETPYGPARVKQVKKGSEVFCYPEYEDVARYADSSGRSFQEVYENIRQIAGEKDDGSGTAEGI